MGEATAAHAVSVPLVLSLSPGFWDRTNLYPSDFLNQSDLIWLKNLVWVCFLPGCFPN